MRFEAFAAGALFGLSIYVCVFAGQAPVVDKPIELPGLQNVIRVADNLLSGSGPEGKEAFESLHRLGIKTIVSVDGAKPNLEAAKNLGMKYVHVPIGYNGVPQERILQLAKAMRELPGPFYVHCHHGKHRGPAAAAIARLCADDKCTTAQALESLEVAGTDPRYKGLFESVAKFTRPKESEWHAARLVESVHVGEFTQSMVSIDHHFDNLKLARKAGWKTPKDHPDVDPAHEALQMLEQYRELRRQPAMRKKPADFQKWLSDGETVAAELEVVLRQAKADKSVDAKKADEAFARNLAVCAACHARYRD